MASLPNLPTSYFGPPKAIISMAQQAKPMGIGIREFERAQLTTESTVVVKYPVAESIGKKPASFFMRSDAVCFVNRTPVHLF